MSPLDLSQEKLDLVIEAMDATAPVHLDDCKLIEAVQRHDIVTAVRRVRYLAFCRPSEFTSPVRQEIARRRRELACEVSHCLRLLETREGLAFG